MIRRSLEESRAYALERKTFGVPIAQHQAIQFMLAEMAIAYEATRLLTHKAAWMVDKGDLSSIVSSYAKAYGADAAMRASTDAVQIFGGYGYTKEYPVEKLMRDAKLLQIYEGTSQIQRIVIARNVLGGQVMKKLVLHRCSCSRVSRRKKKTTRKTTARTTGADRRRRQAPNLPPPPKKKVLTQAELGNCHITASGAVTADQTSPGGRTATNISYWYSPDDQKTMMGVDGFVVNCNGPDSGFRSCPAAASRTACRSSRRRTRSRTARATRTLMIGFGKADGRDAVGKVDITRSTRTTSRARSR